MFARKKVQASAPLPSSLLPQMSLAEHSPHGLPGPLLMDGGKHRAAGRRLRGCDLGS